MLVKIGLKFYSVPPQPTWVTLTSRSRKFCVKVFSVSFGKSISLECVDGSLILCILIDIGLKFYVVPS